MTPGFLAQRSPAITPENSAAIVGALRDIGLLDKEGWLRADPKQFDNKWVKAAFGWDAKLRRELPWLAGDRLPALNLDIRRSHIMQALNCAYARHENVAGARRGGRAGRQGGAPGDCRLPLPASARPSPARTGRTSSPRLPSPSPSPADYLVPSLMWLEARGTRSIDWLVRQYAVPHANLAALTARRRAWPPILTPVAARG